MPATNLNPNFGRIANKCRHRKLYHSSTAVQHLPTICLRLSYLLQPEKNVYLIKSKGQAYQMKFFLASIFQNVSDNIFLISALASKMSQSKKLVIIYHLSSMIFCIFFYLTHFRELGQKYKYTFVRFWFK